MSEEYLYILEEVAILLSMDAGFISDDVLPDGAKNYCRNPTFNGCGFHIAKSV